MAVTEIHTLATQVQEQCAVPVDQDTIIEFLRPILRDFDVDPTELVGQTVKHFEAAHIDEGGIIIEWDGECGAVTGDEDEDDA